MFWRDSLEPPPTLIHEDVEGSLEADRRRQVSICSHSQRGYWADIVTDLPP